MSADPETDLLALERRVAQLEDRQAIVDVYVTYAWLQDRSWTNWSPRSSPPTPR